jgi:hypothetical protein
MTITKVLQSAKIGKERYELLEQLTSEGDYFEIRMKTGSLILYSQREAEQRFNMFVASAQ